MHPNIEHLYNIANKPTRRILGLMSGTSLDGLDIALCEVKDSGAKTVLKLIEFTTVPYTADFKEKVFPIFSKQVVSLEQLCLLNPWIALQHAAMIKAALMCWDVKANSIDLIASHGQTIYHAPKSLHPNDEFGPATLQIGDGDSLAVATGIITISDFRQKHIAAGGDGAPLAVYGDYLLCANALENRVLLNIGGIANFTYVEAGSSLSQIISSDTGPGNTLMDAYVRKHFNDMLYDKDGIIASKGTINLALLTALRSDSFFAMDLPKSIGPELFNLAYLNTAQIQSNTESISKEDVLATLNRFTAETIAEAINKCIPPNTQFAVYKSGGGAHNALLVKHLVALLPNAKVASTMKIGIQPDAKEAILFALLANECVAGTPLYAGEKATKVPITMGKISLPN
ncbi:MAG: anhydro-N-acetylmuramic acid kinase [Bacteroidota bacterium]|jgi:anhydro-N-acetylmuramic acid kinase